MPFASSGSKSDRSVSRWARSAWLTRRSFPLLHKLGDATLITHDRDFFEPDWIHPAYCLAFLDVREDDLADVARRFLQHSAFNTSAKRMGKVVSVGRSGISLVHKKRRQPVLIDWEE